MSGRNGVDASRLVRYGWVCRRNDKSAVILSESANGCVTWRYKGHKRSWLTTKRQFISRFYLPNSAAMAPPPKTPTGADQ